MPCAPRSVLRHVCGLYEQNGLEPGGRAELEFYLTARNTDSEHAAEGAGSAAAAALRPRARPTIDAVNEFDPLFEDIYDYCQKMELNVDTLIHEVGAGQMEINFFHADPLGLADEVFFMFKRTVREARCATTCTRPSCGKADRGREPGSAMHIHQSIVDKEPAGTSSAGKTAAPSDACFHFIGGLQRYIPAAMALVAPYVNSYRRPARHTAAPINIEWGTTTAPSASARRSRSPRRAPGREPRHRRRRQPPYVGWRWRWPAATWA